jgi:small ubiquitin-related modifier
MDEPPKADEFLTIKVVDQNGEEVQFRIKKTTPMKKMMSVYIEKHGMDPNAVRFLYDGKRIDEKDTAQSLDMEDQDVVDAVLSQSGGSWKWR